MQRDIIIGLFLYYFCGLVISRIGSLILEPALKKVSFVTFASYRDFVRVSTKDPTVEILSEVNNMYRTLSALFFVLLVIKPFEIVMRWFNLNADTAVYILFVILFVLFALSYRKQTKYITQRVEAGKDKHR
jgi:succinate-acetate transporter protein